MPQGSLIPNIKACGFDAYGTLFDVHSAVGATAFGLRVAWINRFAQRQERLPFQPDIEIKTLDELPSLLSK